MTQNPATHSNATNLQILYEDNHLVIVNKRVGDIVQGDKTGDTPLSDHVKAYIKHRYSKPGKVFLGVVHRLDRPTSGIVVFARTSKALARMNALFANKTVQKTYWAIVRRAPDPSQGTLIHWLRKNPKNNKSKAFDTDVSNSKKAILQYRVIQALDRYHLLEIELETGRHHQIRSQLAAIGSPIKGDLKYGFDRSNSNAGIHLHARRLRFEHPVKKTGVDIVAPLPADPLWDVCES